MSTYRLDKLFAPRSIAVVGASPRPELPRPDLPAQSDCGRLRGRDLFRQSAPCRNRGKALLSLSVRASRGARSHDRRRASGQGARRHRGGVRGRRERRHRCDGGAGIRGGLARRSGPACGPRPWAAPRRSELHRRAGATGQDERELRGPQRASRAISRSSRNRAPWRRAWWNGRRSAMSASRPSCPSATRSTSISAIASTTSRPMPAPGRSCSTSSPSTTRRSSCRRPALPPA